ncbi:MAG: 16S rRNA (cytosine(1402)-N(4))-methyltransferase RsmH [Gammaproteobacteria bacterium]|nr:16S rRNA (cytosine(1402)-N(4))-methyltransferase RsmH [Gammaproteobacteria bacterium]
MAGVAVGGAGFSFAVTEALCAESPGGEHAPVLRNAAIEALAIRSDGCYVDATFGRGGHAGEILGRLGEEGKLVVFDRDPEAAAAAAVLFDADPRVRFVRARFSRLLQHIQPASADGVLFDLGVSSPQLDEARRGFSFLRDGPLDMRMDPDEGASAADFLARADEREIAGVIARLGEERHAKRIAHAIVAARGSGPIATTGRLAGIVAAAVPGREAGRHPATRTFQALRIHVNDELGEFERALPQAVAALKPRGRLVVISFHSLEDRIVKRFLRSGSRADPAWAGLPEMPAVARPRLRLVGRATFADEAEIARNPRARSAVMRVAERLRE